MASTPQRQSAPAVSGSGLRNAPAGLAREFRRRLETGECDEIGSLASVSGTADKTVTLRYRPPIRRHRSGDPAHRNQMPAPTIPADDARATAGGGGVGLSLAIVAAIAAAHGATLNATARSEGGPAVEVVFPSVSDSHQPLATGLAGVTSASGVELL
jgi:hypothetical protein